MRRLDRLITDISDASRLDAELQRDEVAPVDLHKLAQDRGRPSRNEVKQDDGVTIKLSFEGGGLTRFIVPGHDRRLGQVITNLIDNARSFSPPGGDVRVTCRRAAQGDRDHRR